MKKKRKSRSGENISAAQHNKGVQGGATASSDKEGPADNGEWRIYSLLKKRAILVEIICLSIIIGIGLLVRVEDYKDWKSAPARAFFEGEPLLTTFDGYYYLSLAQDLLDGTYEPVDTFRAVPDYPRRPEPPPLISVIAAGVSKITGLSLNWVGVFLPPVLGVLLALPLYMLGRFYGGPAMGLTSALMGLLSFYYVYRSNIGWFDTDCMNVTWATCAAYCFLKFGVLQERKRYAYLVAGFVVYGLFLWWWDQTPQVTTVITLLPLAVAIIFFYRPSRKEGMIFAGIICAGIIALLAWKGLDMPVKIIRGVISQYSYISKDVASDFPNIGVTISEQARPSFSEIVRKTTGSLPVFIFGVAGLLFLFYRRPKESLFLSVPLILGCLSFLFAKRFIIFLAPVLALGTGFLVAELWRLRSRHIALGAVAPVLVLVLAYPAFSKGMSKTFWPKEPPHLVRGMVEAGKKTPEDAVIWAWWDHGYNMIYWARRGTINDGQVHTPERSVYNAIPYTTQNVRLAANFMQFYVARGLSGINMFYEAVGGDKAKGLAMIKRIMAMGPQKARFLIDSADIAPSGAYRTVDDWLRFFFPDDARPVYLFIDWRLTVTSYWWFWLGSWDIEKHDGIHPTYKAYYGMKKIRDLTYANRSISVDFRNGIVHRGRRQVALKKGFINFGKKFKKFDFPNGSKYDFELLAPAGFGALEDPAISNSVFNKLFLRHINPRPYFTPVVLRTPSFQIWKVTGDRLVRPGAPPWNLPGN